ncbi:hypothetical protein HK104_008679 [Borealophlyctis nickersoniae]|nr:hypothetical protein HK104_008679 [Borealophlyctis nickersoniae]
MRSFTATLLALLALSSSTFAQSCTDAQAQSLLTRFTNLIQACGNDVKCLCGEPVNLIKQNQACFTQNGAAEQANNFITLCNENTGSGTSTLPTGSGTGSGSPGNLPAATGIPVGGSSGTLPAATGIPTGTSTNAPANPFGAKNVGNKVETVVWAGVVAAAGAAAVALI